MFTLQSSTAARRLVWVLLTLVWGLTLPARAELADNLSQDLQLWQPTVLQIPVTERAKFSLLTMGSAYQNWSSPNFLLYAPSVNIQVTPSVEAGVEWMHIFFLNNRFRDETLSETRISPYVTWRKNFPRLSLQARAMTENRFATWADAFSVRQRLLVGGRTPVGKKGTYLFITEELLLNLDNRFPGSSAGIGQNRLTAGLGHTFRNGLSVEGGYMLFFINADRGISDQLNHTMILGLRYAPPMRPLLSRTRRVDQTATDPNLRLRTTTAAAPRL